MDGHMEVSQSTFGKILIERSPGKIGHNHPTGSHVTRLCGFGPGLFCYLLGPTSSSWQPCGHN
eukprot:12796-Eustigmatos_ZCMA.PRE.1